MVHVVNQLQRICRELPPEAQNTLLAFAQFLHTQHQQSPPSPPPLCVIPRPPQESVIAALKRLSQTYPMLDKARLLNETSAIVAGIVQDKNQAELIDELERIFARHYQNFLDHQSAE